MNLTLRDANPKRIAQRGDKALVIPALHTLRLLYDGLWSYDNGPARIATFVEGVNHDSSTDGWLLDDGASLFLSERQFSEYVGVLFSDIEIGERCCPSFYAENNMPHCCTHSYMLPCSGWNGREHMPSECKESR